MANVLMIDDDAELCEMVAEYLAPEAFAVTAVHDGLSGIERVQAGAFDIVLLDVMLPGLNGFEVLRRLRSAKGPVAATPVLMLTARGQTVDRIVGLEVGADDYLAKPFDERELVARMRAILRRARVPVEETVATRRELLRADDVSVDLGARSTRRGDEIIALTAVEFDILVMLLRAVGSVVTREHITRDVLDRKLASFDRSVDTHISRLRRKLGPHADGQDRIKTVRSIGYVYTAPAGN